MNGAGPTNKDGPQVHAADERGAAAGAVPSHAELARRLDELKSIARSVALDAGLLVELGKEGEGSFCAYGGPSPVQISKTDRSITIDPQHLLVRGVPFIVAHEGMHAHVTFSPFDRDIFEALRQVPTVQGPFNPEALHQEIGVAALLNFLEDCGGNSWLTNSYPGLRADGKALYDKMLGRENPTMSVPEVAAVMAQLGFYPRFAQYGSEVMKKWWTGEYSKKLDPAVAAALEKHEPDVQRYFDSFAPGQTADLKERQGQWISRYLTATLRIFPTIKKLVEKDLEQAAQQQLANRMQRQGQQSQQGQQGQQVEKSQQGQQGQQSPQSSCGQGGSAGAGVITRKVQQEIERRAAEHQSTLRKQLDAELDRFDQHLYGRTQDTSANNSQRPAPSDAELGAKLDALTRKVASRFDRPEQAAQRQSLEQQLKTFEELKDSINKQSAPLEELSDDARKAIDKAFEKLTPAEKQELKERGKQLLEQLEDKLRKALESELQDNKPQTHGERRQQAEGLRRAAERDAALDRATEQMQAEYQASLGAWDKIRQTVAPIVNTMYSRLERLLRPTVPEWDAGHASGSRVNPLAAMQAEADPSLAGKIWDRKTLPAEKSYVFSLLVDVSASMGDEKSARASECAVLMSEVLTRLKVPFEISIFDENHRVIRSFDDPSSKQHKDKIAGFLHSGGGGTNDFAAIQRRADALATREEEIKFLIVITDGGSSNPSMLTDALGNALQRNIRVLGIGIGSDTRDVDTYYPIGRGGLTLDPKDKQNGLGPYFTRTLEQILTDPQGLIREALNKRQAVRDKGGIDGSDND